MFLGVKRHREKAKAPLPPKRSRRTDREEAPPASDLSIGSLFMAMLSTCFGGSRRRRARLRKALVEDLGERKAVEAVEAVEDEKDDERELALSVMTPARSLPRSLPLPEASHWSSAPFGAFSASGDYVIPFLYTSPTTGELQMLWPAGMTPLAPTSLALPAAAHRPPSLALPAPPSAPPDPQTPPASSEAPHYWSRARASPPGAVPPSAPFGASSASTTAHGASMIPFPPYTSPATMGGFHPYMHLSAGRTPIATPAQMALAPPAHTDPALRSVRPDKDCKQAYLETNLFKVVSLLVTPRTRVGKFFVEAVLPSLGGAPVSVVEGALDTVKAEFQPIRSNGHTTKTKSNQVVIGIAERLASKEAQFTLRATLVQELFHAASLALHTRRSSGPTTPAFAEDNLARAFQEAILGGGIPEYDEEERECYVLVATSGNDGTYEQRRLFPSFEAYLALGLKPLISCDPDPEHLGVPTDAQLAGVCPRSKCGTWSQGSREMFMKFMEEKPRQGQ